MGEVVAYAEAEETKSPDPAKIQERWDKEIAAAQKRTRQWHKQGGKVVKRFLDSRDDEHSYSRKLNLFHNHISTLTAMLYGKLPKVDVNRRFSDADDDASRVASLILGRILNTDIEMSGQKFSSVLKSCLQDWLLPGMGTARVRYEMETEMVEVPEQRDPEGFVVVAGGEEEKLAYEEAPIDYVHWRDFLWGYCRNWGECPWVAFRSFMDADECIKRFGEEKAKQLQYSIQTPGGDKDDAFDRDFKDPNEKAEIWEIWNESDNKVYWWSKGQSAILDVQDDPLGLTNFFPCPAPMMSNVTTTLFMPKPDFVIAQDLYNEIDILQSRITAITKAVKVVGVYDKSADGLKRMFSEGMENDLIPVDNWAMFAEKGGLKGVVDWFPVQDVVETLSRLREIRQETIALLYSVTGLSEILRGSASGGQPTSATENALKARFASVRVQYLQDEFARFASDLQTLKSEIISQHFEPATMVQRSNVDKTPDAQHIQGAIQLIKSGVLPWRVEIRPESIAMVDYAQLKSERTEYLMALSTYLQSSQAMMKVMPEAGTILLEMMKWGLAGFKGSTEIEGVVDQAISAAQEAAKNPKPPQPSPEEMKHKAEMEKLQMKHQQDMQKQQTKAIQDLQKLHIGLQAEMQKIQAQTQATVIEEAAQAKFNIMEAKASNKGD